MRPLLCRVIFDKFSDLLIKLQPCFDLNLRSYGQLFFYTLTIETKILYRLNSKDLKCTRLIQIDYLIWYDFEPQ